MSDEYNGGSMVGMVGKGCVGIATDRRLGKRMLTVTNKFQKVFKMQDNILLGLTGLATDVQTLYLRAAEMEYRINLYTLKENKPMKPTTFCNLVAYALFERRYPSTKAGSVAITFSPS
jgi:20S proteasome subunit beta 3